MKKKKELDYRDTPREMNPHLQLWRRYHPDWPNTRRIPNRQQRRAMDR